MPDVALQIRRDTFSDRVSHSCGTARAYDLPDCLGYYSSASVVPRGPWRPAELSDYSVVQDTHLPSNRTVAIFAIPADVRTRMQELGIQKITNADTCNAFNSSDNRDALARLVLDGLRGLAVPPDASIADYKNLGIRVGEPELPTVTWDYDLRIQVGLHIDDWDRLRIAEREVAKTRLCVNLGEERRYLLVVDLTARRLLESLGLKGDGKGTDIAREFLLKYPTYPVTRLEMWPGEAYLAPTDNIIHDGSTLGASTVDRCLSILGDFAVGPHLYDHA